MRESPLTLCPLYSFVTYWVTPALLHCAWEDKSTAGSWWLWLMVTLWSTSIFVSVVSCFIFSSLGILEFSIMEPNQWCEPLSSDTVWLWRNNNCGFQHQGGDIFLEKRNKDLRRRVQHYSSYHFIVHDLPLCSRGLIFKKNEFCIKFWVWLLQKIWYLPIQMMSWMHKWSHQWVICTFSHEKKFACPLKT